jgi:two-component system chemotaxis response regulator CheV
MNIQKSEILLETGTNELELLEFVIAGNSFGINVSKIKELMQANKPQPMPNAHPCIEGVFQPRQEVYTIVNLPMYLGLPDSETPEKDIYIITSFNKMNAAFHVHGVMGIDRISWTAIEKPDVIIYGGDDGVVTGIAKVGDRIISILDFEKITYDISPQSGIMQSDIDMIRSDVVSDKPILVAEDSPLLRRMIHESLRAAGHTNIIMTTNGQEAWNMMQEIRHDPDNIFEHVSCVITDIEMPQMDGHKLTKLIKSDSVLRKVPVIIFSSLIEESMMLKGAEVGADAQLSKPEIGNLVQTINDIYTKFNI